MGLWSSVSIGVWVKGWCEYRGMGLRGSVSTGYGVRGSVSTGVWG